MHITQIWSCVIWPSTSCNLITRVLTVCHVKLTQNTALQQKCVDLQSLSPGLPNLWLLLVINMIFRLSKVSRVRDQLLEAVWDKHRGFSTTHFLCTRGFSYMESWITGQKEDYVIRGKKGEKLQRNPTYLKLSNATAFWASGAIKSLRMVFFMNFLTGFLEKFKFNDCTDITRHWLYIISLKYRQNIYLESFLPFNIIKFWNDNTISSL